MNENPDRVLTPRDVNMHDDGFMEWLKAHDVEPSNTFKVEFKGDAPGKMTVHQYALDDDGRKYVVKTLDGEKSWNPKIGEAAIAKPFVVELKSEPPPVVVEGGPSRRRA